MDFFFFFTGLNALQEAEKEVLPTKCMLGVFFASL